VNLATLPDIVLDNIVDKLDAISNCAIDLVSLSYTSKRLNQFANRGVYMHIHGYNAANPLLREGLVANPINRHYIETIQCFHVDDLARLWSLPPMTRLRAIKLYEPEGCLLSSITACLAARHPDFTMHGSLNIHDMKHWEFLLPAFNDLAEVSIRFGGCCIYDRPSAQKVVDSLQFLSLRRISLMLVSDWRLDLGERFPKLEALEIHGIDTLGVFDSTCWHRVTALMDRSINYSCKVGGTSPLYQAVLAHAELNGLEPAPIIRWLAAGDIKAGRFVNIDNLESHHLLKVLRSIESIDGDFKLRLLKIRLYAEYINEIFSLVPRSVTYLVLTTQQAARIPPDKFLDFFLSLPKLGALEVFVRGDPRPFTGEIWPAGYLTHASVPFVGTHKPRAGMCVTALCKKTGGLTGTLYSELEPNSIDRSCADFAVLSKEIMSWFGMKPSLRSVSLWRAVTGAELA
jgi:hypothetical protein